MPYTDRYRRGRLGRYAVAVAATALAAGLWSLLTYVVASHPPLFVLFTGAVAISAWLGGLGPALASLALSVVLSPLLLYPQLSFEVADWTELLDLCIFVGVDLALALAIESMHRARRSAEARAAELALASAAERAWKERYEAAVRASGHVLYDMDRLDGRVMFGGACEQILGCTAEELGAGACDWHTLIHPDDAARYHRFRPGDDAFGLPELEYRVRRRCGRYVVVHDVGEQIRAPDGRVARVVGFLKDVTESKATAAQLAEAHRKLEESFALIDALVLNAPIGMALVDTELRYVRINDKLAALNGVPAAEHIGRSIAEILPALWPAIEPVLRRGLAFARAETDVEVRGETPSAPGQLRHFIFSQYPIRAADTLLGLGFAVVETTEQKRVEASLREADRRKDAFIATLAHELRNPLAPIRTALAMLRLARVRDAERGECLDVIGRQIDQMTRLLEDLLDVSRITRGKLTLRRTSAELKTIMERAAETARPMITARGHRFEVDLPGDPVFLDADPLRLAQVFSNLITNAAKYSDRRSTIRVRARLAGTTVEVAVEDSGIGIAPDHLPRVFEMFSQVSPAHERSEGGLGIGLALSRGLVEMHGGTIEARSAGLGHGSEFVVRLPVAQVRPPGPRPPVHDHLAPAPGHRIVVADDNVDNADSLAMFLRAFGNEVRVAHDGAEAVALCAEFRPDVALLDIGMPQMNGWEACRSIRAQPWGKTIVLVAQTGWGQREDRRRSEEAGFDHHLTKPVDPDRLLALLAALPAGPAAR